MNLKERMQRQNKNNSSIMNNSNFDFAKINKEDMIYQKSRRQCEEELYKRKSDIEQERHLLHKMKDKEVNYALEKFLSDFEQFRKQIITYVDQSLLEMKSKYTAEIKQRCSIETSDEVKLKNQIDQFLTIINNHLTGLKTDHYREYIAKIVLTDYDSRRDEVKNNLRKLKYPMPYTTLDEKAYNCFRSELNKLILVQFGQRRQGQQQPRKNQEQIRAPVLPYVYGGDLNLHQNRDRLKKSYA